jgi:hypothetical protein
MKTDFKKAAIRFVMAFIAMALLADLLSCPKAQSQTLSDKNQIVTLTPVFGIGSMAKIGDSLSLTLPYNAVRFGVKTKLNFTKNLAFKYDAGLSLGEKFNFTSYCLNYNKAGWDISLGQTASV